MALYSVVAPKNKLTEIKAFVDSVATEKVKEIFVQFHGLSSSRNDLYRDDWFPGSTYWLCLESLLYPIKSG